MLDHITISRSRSTKTTIKNCRKSRYPDPDSIYIQIQTRSIIYPEPEYGQFTKEKPETNQIVHGLLGENLSPFGDFMTLSFLLEDHVRLSVKKKFPQKYWHITALWPLKGQYVQYFSDFRCFLSYQHKLSNL